ncbi:MAG: hydroxyacylglutathione hydrolase [Coxiella sp. RIFCSPHIGHO2_12_FULL_42_15]|nr:MAG: hydroxyacylglutathione hydrolase [Coxiella sp. RIFCSPHIGHO2_12_FULL_42_15]
MPLNIHPIKALKDNYIWAIVNDATSQVAVLDPGDAQPVFDFLQHNPLQLVAILVTHRHWDHTNGIASLVERFNVPVYGPEKDLLPIYTVLLNDHDQVHLLELEFEVLSLPGHTHGHIAYYGHCTLFCGDTLFSAGCGRMFEGTPSELYHSLQRLAALPQETEVYCGHEYTFNNLRFASLVEPHNDTIQTRLTHIKNQPVTLPSSLAIELATNPFLRCHIKEVRESAAHYIGHELNDPIAVFAALRQWKDQF